HRRLAAARLADHAERLALLEREVHAVDGLDLGDLFLEDQAARDGEVLLEVLDGEQLAHAALPSAASSAAFFASQIRARSSSARWQRKLWPSPTTPARRSGNPSPPAPRSGNPSRQRSNTYGQRGLKAQPFGGRSREGGWPGICSRRSAVALSRGNEPSSPQ